MLRVRDAHHHVADDAVVVVVIAVTDGLAGEARRLREAHREHHEVLIGREHPAGGALRGVREACSRSRSGQGRNRITSGSRWYSNTSAASDGLERSQHETLGAQRLVGERRPRRRGNAAPADHRPPRARHVPRRSRDGRIHACREAYCDRRTPTPTVTRSDMSRCPDPRSHGGNPEVELQRGGRGELRGRVDALSAASPAGCRPQLATSVSARRHPRDVGNPPPRHPPPIGDHAEHRGDPVDPRPLLTGTRVFTRSHHGRVQQHAGHVAQGGLGAAVVVAPAAGAGDLGVEDVADVAAAGPRRRGHVLRIARLAEACGRPRRRVRGRRRSRRALRAGRGCGWSRGRAARRRRTSTTSGATLRGRPRSMTSWLASAAADGAGHHARYSASTGDPVRCASMSVSRPPSSSTRSTTWCSAVVQVTMTSAAAATKA